MKGRRGEKKVDIGEGDLGWGFDSAEINSFFLSKDRLFVFIEGFELALKGWLENCAKTDDDETIQMTSRELSFYTKMIMKD